MTNGHILIVDDEKNIRHALKSLLMDEGYRISEASSGDEALTFLQKYRPDIILLDIWMPGLDGLEVLQKIKTMDQSISVLMMSGHGTIETAVRATKLGAYDFIEKPLSIDRLLISIGNVLSIQKLKEENKILREKVDQKYLMVGRSSGMKKVLSQIQLAAPSQSWILITGENGTGKELVARNIHAQSSRQHQPFIEVNCAAIPEELIESELFGHEKGAFTGATSSRKGKFELADGGTLFLDEIGDMSLRTQAKILRVLQEQKFEHVGGTHTFQVDVRVIGATNKDLKSEIQKGKFREDLFYRLNVIPIHVPPLRERREDIPEMVLHFLDIFSKENGKKKKQISKEALGRLQAYPFPGNVRELKNMIERLVIMSPDSEIQMSDISLSDVDENESIGGDDSLRIARTRFEREFLLKKLQEFDGNISKTAKAIGIERSNLHRKIKTYDIEM